MFDLVNTWTSAKKHGIPTRHLFVIGPPRDANLPAVKGRLYYCYRCKWRFLVCGSKIAVLDEDGKPLFGDQALERFNTFEEGPCPVMEAFAASRVAGDLSGGSSRRESDEFAGLAADHVSPRPGGARPMLRLLARMRKDLGGLDDLPYRDRNSAGIRLPADRDDPPRMVLATKPLSLRRN